MVVFANLPDPKEFDVDIEKKAEYLGEGDLLGDAYQPIQFTLSRFTSDTVLPLENATLTDETFTFKDAGGKDVTGVEWYVESIVIGAADYEATAYDDTPSDAPIYANLRTKGADDSWSEYTQYAISSEKTVTFAANTCYGVEIVTATAMKKPPSTPASRPTPSSSTSRPVSRTMTRAPSPVKTIGNTASIEMTYDFGIMGAQDTTATRTKDASASASTTVKDEPALPRVSIKKTSQVQNALGEEEIKGETVTPGQRLFYTVTLTGVTEEGWKTPSSRTSCPPASPRWKAASSLRRIPQRSRSPARSRPVRMSGSPPRQACPGRYADPHHSRRRLPGGAHRRHVPCEHGLCLQPAYRAQEREQQGWLLLRG